MAISQDKVTAFIDKISSSASAMERPRLYKAMSVVSNIPLSRNNIRTMLASDDVIVNAAGKDKDSERINYAVTAIAQMVDDGAEDIDDMYDMMGVSRDDKAEAFIDALYTSSFDK